MMAKHNKLKLCIFSSRPPGQLYRLAPPELLEALLAAAPDDGSLSVAVLTCEDVYAKVSVGDTPDDIRLRCPDLQSTVPDRNEGAWYLNSTFKGERYVGP
jgi:hypothetical protein